MDAKYMSLVARCPLLPITTEKDHDLAKDMVVELTKRDGKLSMSEIGYGKVLVHLIQVYERQLIGNYFARIGGAEALDYLLTEHRMKQTEAAEIAGVSKQNLNDFLKGRRALTRDARANLAAFFKVEPQVFELEKELSSA